MINVNDEPGGLDFAGPDYTAAFRKYLTDLHLVPSDFGVTDFSQLEAKPRTPPPNPNAFASHVFY